MSRALVEKKLNEMYGENTIYILRDYDINQSLERIDRYEDKGDTRMAEFCTERILENAEKFNNDRFTPVTVNVGDGATVHLFSDSHACTVIKKTKCTITVQYDKATLDPNFKPEWIEGGFAGHCTNQGDQTYTYERDPEGRTEVYRWSNKYNRYQGGGDGSVKVSKGRREFYDYNF